MNDFLQRLMMMLRQRQEQPIPGINGQPLPPQNRPPIPPSQGIVRGDWDYAPERSMGNPWIYSDTPGTGHQSNWMDQMQNKIPGSTNAASNQSLLAQFNAYLKRKGVNVHPMDLERLFTQQIEAQMAQHRQVGIENQQELLRNQ